MGKKSKTHKNKSKHVSVKETKILQDKNVKDSTSVTVDLINNKGLLKSVDNTTCVKPRYTVEQLLERVEEYIDSFQYDLAEKFCERVLQIGPDNVKALELSGFLSIQSGDTERAKHSFKHAIDLMPDEGHSKYMYMGQMATGKDSIQFFLKGIELMKNSNKQSSDATVQRRDISSAYCSVAEIYLTDECFEDDADALCKQYLDAAITADTANPVSYHLLTSYWLCKQDKQAANEAMEKGLSLWLPLLKDSEVPQGAVLDIAQECTVSYQDRVSCSKMLIELEKYDTASEILELLLDEDDQIVDVWYLLGWLNVLRGEDFRLNAISYLKRAMEVSVETHFDDVSMTNHIDELLEELGPDDEEDEPIDEMTTHDDDNYDDNDDSDVAHDVMEH